MQTREAEPCTFNGVPPDRQLVAQCNGGGLLQQGTCNHWRAQVLAYELCDTRFGRL